MTLPWITRVFITVSKVLTNPWLALPTLLGAAVGVLFLPRLKPLFWKVALHLPFLGDLLRTVGDIRMLTMLALMLQSGLHLSRALAVMPGLSLDPHARQAWIGVQKGVLEGRTLPQEISAAGLFGRTVRALLHCGDEGGEIVRLMQWSAEMLDQELNFKVQRLISVIEPLTIAGLGIVAAVAVLAAFLPLIDLIQAFM